MRGLPREYCSTPGEPDSVFVKMNGIIFFYLLPSQACQVRILLKNHGDNITLTKFLSVKV